MTTNLYRRLADLMPGVAGPAAPTLAGTVTVVHGDGTATVAMPGGGFVRVRNPDGKTVSDSVFVQSGAIVGDAPALTPVSIFI